MAVGVITAGVSVALLVTGCFSPKSRDCVISCAGAEDCPSGMVCTTAGRCAASAAVACSDSTDDAGTGVDGAPTDGSVVGPVSEAVLGNLFTFTFDPSPYSWSTVALYPADQVVRDRSGRGLNAYGHAMAYQDSYERIPGRYGMAAPLDDGSLRSLFVPLKKLPASFTFEAWVAPNDLSAKQTLITNRTVNGFFWEIYLDDQERVVFEATPPCAGEGASRQVKSNVALQTSTKGAPQFQYVAVTFDQDTSGVRIVAGDESSASLIGGPPCDTQNDGSISIGATAAQGERFFGAIDEIKLSSWVKDDQELEQSRGYDSTQLIERCGDGFIEGSELCEHPSLCCDDTCQPEDGIDCEAGVCQMGVCVGAPEIVPEPLRRYSFTNEDGQPNVVDDSGEDPLELFGDVVWTPVTGKVVLHAPPTEETPPRLESTLAVDAVVEKLVIENEFTIHLRLRPAQVEPGRPARILSIAADTQMRNLTIGQSGAFFVARVRTQVSGPGLFDAVPALVAPRMYAGTWVDMAFVRNSNGTESLYVDGRLVASGMRKGNLAPWDTQTLTLGDETGTTADDHRGWQGTYDLVEIYDVALSPEFVAQLAP